MKSVLASFKNPFIPSSRIGITKSLVLLIIYYRFGKPFEKYVYAMYIVTNVPSKLLIIKSHVIKHSSLSICPIVKGANVPIHVHIYRDI